MRVVNRLLFLWVWLCCIGLPAAGREPAPGFLVLGPARFEKSLRPFLRARNRELPTRFASLEQVLKGTPGRDDPERVKRYLYDRYRTQRVRYVLLVGDADVFPVRYMVLDRVTAPAFDYAFYPSDLYYADVAKSGGGFEDWNAATEGFHAGYWGEVRGEKNKSDAINFDQVDYLPELAVGRWPVSRAEEVEWVAAKSLGRGARVLSDGSQPVAMFVAVDGWVDARPQLRQAAGQLPGAWGRSFLFYGEGAGTAPTEERVVEGLNAGADLVFHAGHGSDDSWERCISVRSLERLRNQGRLPVVISAGCSTARFATLPPYEPYVDVEGREHEGTDRGEIFQRPPAPPACYQGGRFNPPGLGELLLRGGTNGAVAYIGCNTGSQPCALTLLEGFADALGKDPDVRLGDAWASAVRFYHRRERLADLKPNDDWYPPSIFFQGMKFMLFGDPTLRVIPGPRRAQPAAR